MNATMPNEPIRGYEPSVLAVVLDVSKDIQTSSLSVGGLSPKARISKTLDKLGVPIIPESDLKDELIGSAKTLLVLRNDHVYDLEFIKFILSEKMELPIAVFDSSLGDMSPALYLISGSNLSEIQSNLLPTIEKLRIPLKDVSSFNYYNEELRKVVQFRIFHVTESRVNEIEEHLLNLANKGTNDWVAMNLHPTPQNWITKQLWRIPWITPNAITLFAIAGSLVAAYLFSQGSFLIATLWGNLQGILDGVDGKLARTRIQFSRLGAHLDHVSDQVYEVLWYLGIGLAFREKEIFGFSGWALAWIWMGAYYLDRIITGTFAKLNTVQLHDYRPFDRWVRKFAARRNNNLLLFLPGAAFGLFWEVFLIALVYVILSTLTKLYRFLWIYLKNLPPLFTTETNNGF